VVNHAIEPGTAFFRVVSRRLHPPSYQNGVNKVLLRTGGINTFSPLTLTMSPAAELIRSLTGGAADGVGLHH
jgi:hypothetical protein